MPLLWRYLLSHYLKTFFLCVVAFLAILLTMRLEEIAYFATLGAEIGHIIWFALQQIPYIIPIAIPVSALISSMLLMQQLSQAKELTAMRACGFSMKDILAPILIASLFLSAANFYIISELSTTSHLGSGLLKNQLRSINPLLLLNNKHIMQIKGFFFDTRGPSKLGEYAQDIIFLSPNKRTGRLDMLTAKKLTATPEAFYGQQVSILTTLPNIDRTDGENIILENMQETTTSIEDFSQILEKKAWSINNDYLQLPLLLVRLNEGQAQLAQASLSNDKEGVRKAADIVNCCLTEIMRRFSVAIAVFSFTLMGLAFGINISRNQSNIGIISVMILGALFLIAIFTAKNFEHALYISALLYIVPHLLIWASSFWRLNRTAKGIE